MRMLLFFNNKSRYTATLTLVLAGLLLALCLVTAGAAQQERQRVFVIPVRGEVDPSMAAFIERAVRQTARYPDALLVFEMDTFGGRVDSALDIVQTLLHTGSRKTVAFVKTKAISAGSLIALACNDLVMRPNTTIGDCAPITYSGEGLKMLGEKFQSPLRAEFRTLARRNHYPPTLAESMVTEGMEVYAVSIKGKTRYLDRQQFADLSAAEKKEISSKKTVVAKGELLTMDDAEARTFGFSRMTASSIAEMLAARGITNYRLIRIRKNWSENFGRLIGKIAPILLIIGLGALYVELRVPGFGLPGIIGLLCLGLVFFNQYLVGLANYIELLLMVLGIVLLAMEIFVLPGFGIAGIAGFICIGIGMILSFQGFVIPNPALPWQGHLLTANIIRVLGAFVAAFLLALLFLRYLLPRIGRVVEGPFLGHTLAESRADSRESKNIKPGDLGVALTFLRPAGKVKIGNTYFDVVSEGEFLEKDTPVVVSEIKGNRVIVKRRQG